MTFTHPLHGTRPRTLEFRLYHIFYLEPDLTTWTLTYTLIYFNPIELFSSPMHIINFVTVLN